MCILHCDKICVLCIVIKFVSFALWWNLCFVYCYKICVFCSVIKFVFCALLWNLYLLRVIIVFIIHSFLKYVLIKLFTWQETIFPIKNFLTANIALRKFKPVWSKVAICCNQNTIVFHLQNNNLLWNYPIVSVKTFYQIY